MRKLIILLLSCTLLLCSCSSNKIKDSKSAQIPSGFSATADITYGDLAVTADLSRTKKDAITLTVKSPEPLNGMQFTYDGSKTTVSYYGISFDLPQNTATAKAVANTICNVIKDTETASDVTATEKNGKIELCGKIDEGKYTVTMDKKSRAILTISMPDIDLNCTFSNFTA